MNTQLLAIVSYPQFLFSCLTYLNIIPSTNLFLTPFLQTAIQKEDILSQVSVTHLRLCNVEACPIFTWP